MSHIFGNDDALQDQLKRQQEQQEQILKQQQAEEAQKQQQLENERIQALRGRFSGAPVDNQSNGADSQLSAASLYSILTGQ